MDNLITREDMEEYFSAMREWRKSRCRNCTNEECELVGTDDFAYFCLHEYKPKPKLRTNSDVIRSMSDEELAELLADIASCWGCQNNLVKTCEGEEFGCTKNILDWLKQEVDDG